jgi:multidrug resistance efflux pump
MAEENNNITQDKKIDALQWQMKSLEAAFTEFKSQQKSDFKEFTSLQKETNARLEVMQRGFVSREEYQEFKRFVGTLALQKDLDEVKGWQLWALRLIVGAVILAVIGLVIVTQ